MSLFRVLAVFFALSLSFVHAAEEKGFTARAFGGYNSVSISSHPACKFKVKPGHIIGVAAGYRFTEMVRVEAEGSYRLNEIQKVSIEGKSGQFMVPINGDHSSAAFMGNVFIDVPFKSNLRPYFGIGIGSVSEFADWKVSVIRDSVWIDMQGYDRTAMAYQCIVGFHVTDTKGTFVGAEFRFLDAALDHMCNCNKAFAFTIHKLF